jgi:hypothetical protein
MRSKTTFLGLAAVTVASITVTLAGCGTGAGGRPPAASTLAATGQAGSPANRHPARSGQAPPAQTAARNSSSPAPSALPTAAPAPGSSHSPAPGSHSPTPRRNIVRLTRGLYTDAPDGTPHYVLAFTSRAGSAVRGSVSYLYQDGRVSSAGAYVGTLSASGKITLTLGRGRALSGRYTGGRLSLADCAAALPLARFAGACTFTYHGHVP